VFFKKLKAIPNTAHLLPKGMSNVSVVNDDCINVANQLSKLGKTCMLNMASYRKPGGGVMNGAMAQEEELARRSNLMYGLDLAMYPLGLYDFIYTKDVTFFKDRDYNIMTLFDCDIITMAAINLNSSDVPKDYKRVMETKISEMLHIPKKYGCKNLVLSAFGCGVFGNDPKFVAEIYKNFLENGFASMYDNISFAILNDHNSVGSNFEIFKNILN
jgi:uncharacterized protein (TIGR02452 family)